jgi:hypothetical protein
MEDEELRLDADTRRLVTKSVGRRKQASDLSASLDDSGRPVLHVRTVGMSVGLHIGGTADRGT